MERQENINELGKLAVLKGERMASTRGSEHGRGSWSSTKLRGQIGQKWAHVPPFEFLSLSHLKAKRNVLVSLESLETPSVRHLDQDWHSDYEEMRLAGYLGNFCKQLHPRI